jgi:putative ABC transport system ATP-binding protein
VSGVLVGTGLVKSFGVNPALTGANLSLGEGEIVAVMGPSGSGKSTLLHCLAGILRPDAGSVTYRRQDLAELSDRERSALRRRSFGFVFQFAQLVPELSCLQNVALPLRLGGSGGSGPGGSGRGRSGRGRSGRGRAEATAHEWLERLEVADIAGKRPGETSGGQAQRVAVARALVTGPAVVFADEPTGALDSLNGERVMQLLTDACRQTGASVLLVTHEARVAAYADREVIVRDGRSRSLEPAR